jgi:hypothetical protein
MIDLKHIVFVFSSRKDSQKQALKIEDNLGDLDGNHGYVRDMTF